MLASRCMVRLLRPESETPSVEHSDFEDRWPFLSLLSSRTGLRLDTEKDGEIHWESMEAPPAVREYLEPPAGRRDAL